MSSKLKKWIIAVVAIMLLAVGVLVAVTSLSNISTTTVYSLKFIEPRIEDEDVQQIFQKEVYLTAEEDNNFDVEVDYSASSMMDFVVSSSNTAVATVSKKSSNVWNIAYHKEGSAVIVVVPEEQSDIRDSFVLVVKENIPVEYFIKEDAENPNYISSNEVNVFADGQYYSFDIDAKNAGSDQNINFDSIYILDNYNKDVFEDVYIDSSAKKLFIKASQNIFGINEVITLQTRYGGEEGTSISHTNINVQVTGNKIENIQLLVSESSNFSGIINVYGDGLINEGERRIDRIYFTELVNTVYLRARVVYTDGRMRDITSDKNFIYSQVDHRENIEITQIPEDQGNYISVKISGNVQMQISISENGVEPSRPVNFDFYDTSASAYQYLINNLLYTKVVDEETGRTYFEYIYWDSRYMRKDAITEDGKIIGFYNGNPTCGEDQQSPSQSSGESDERTTGLFVA